MSLAETTLQSPAQGFSPDERDAIERAILERRSIRAFLPKPVPAALIERVLAVASRAPSGTNMQPWRAYVLGGAEKDRLSQAVVDAFLTSEPGAHTSEYKYYPDQFFEPYQTRRRTVGFDMYGLLGIARGESAKMKAQHARNFTFFDAPVGIIFTIDRRLEIGSWLDYGMFLQNILIAARANGLETCAQAAFASLHAVVRAELSLPAEEIVVCGVSLGFADRDAPINRLETHRSPVSEFATFRGL